MSELSSPCVVDNVHDPSGLHISSGLGQPHDEHDSSITPSWVQKFGLIDSEQEFNCVPSRHVDEDASGFTNA